MAEPSGLNSAPDQSVGDWEQLVKHIFECEDCSKTYPLTGQPKCAHDFVALPSKPATAAVSDQTVADELEPKHFKFPPIGAKGEAKILFVAVCPRYTDKPGRSTHNAPLHNFAMTDLYHFESLAQNLDHRGKVYIGSRPTKHDPQWEGFYQYHAKIATSVYKQPFEKVGVATEMYLCALPSGSPYDSRNSPCAEAFLMRTIRLTKPDFILTFEPKIPVFFQNEVAAFFEMGWPKVQAYRGACVIHLPIIRKGTWNTECSVNWAIEVMNIVKGDVMNLVRSNIPTPHDYHGSPQQVWTYAVGSKPKPIV